MIQKLENKKAHKHTGLTTQQTKIKIKIQE